MEMDFAIKDDYIPSQHIRNFIHDNKNVCTVVNLLQLFAFRLSLFISHVRVWITSQFSRATLHVDV